MMEYSFNFYCIVRKRSSLISDRSKFQIRYANVLKAFRFVGFSHKDVLFDCYQVAYLSNAHNYITLIIFMNFYVAIQIFLPVTFMLQKIILIITSVV